MTNCARSATRRKDTTTSRPSQASLLQRTAVKLACKCEDCAKRKGPLQRAAVSEHSPNRAPPIVYDVLRSPGRALDPITRKFMEKRFEHDFSAVRVHTDPQAAEAARAVNARAYTVGSRIVFGQGEYRPSTNSGQRTLAHELTHVIQQNGQPRPHSSDLIVGRADSQHESEAASIASRIFDRTPLGAISSLSLPTLQRQPIEEWNAGCGICGQPKDVGRRVHSIVLNAFLRKYEAKAHGFQSEVTYQYTSDNDQENGRLDLYRVRQSPDHLSIDIGELKPDNQQGLDEGIDNLKYYEEQIRAALRLASETLPTGPSPSRNWAGGETLEMRDSGRLSKPARRRYESQFPTNQKMGSTSGPYVGRIDDLAPPSPQQFIDPVVGRCSPRVQIITVKKSDVPGLYLYSCSPPRSDLTHGNCCAVGKDDTPIMADKIEGQRLAEGSDTKEEEKKPKRAPIPSAEERKAAREQLRPAIKEMLQKPTSEHSNAARVFLKDAGKSVLVVIGSFLIGTVLSAAALAFLAFLGVTATLGSVAIAILLILGATTLLHSNDTHGTYA